MEEKGIESSKPTKLLRFHDIGVKVQFCSLNLVVTTVLTFNSSLF